LARRRDEARKLVAQGIDPSAERQEAKRQRAEANQAAADTFEAVTREWMTREQERVAEVTANKNRWLFETFLFPEIGGLPLAAITPRVLLDALRKIEAAGKQETARRAKIKAGQVFRFAILEGKVDNDPTAALRGAIKRVKHKHHAAITDPAKIGQLLRDIDGFTGQPVTHAALKLAPLVFVRPGELRGADWSEIDFDGAMWRIPAARMKMKSRSPCAAIRASHCDPARPAPTYWTWTLRVPKLARCQPPNEREHSKHRLARSWL
jgi:integrase